MMSAPGLLPRSCKRFLFMALLLFSLFMTLTYYRSVLTTQKMRYVGDQNRTRSHQPFEGIPKIIHQIWKDDVIPDVFVENIKGLVAHNKSPEWQYFFWTDEAGDKFLKNNYPSLLRRFRTARTVLKADILRLAIIYHYGGVYYDLDTVGVKPLDPFVETHSCSFTTDPPEHILFYMFRNKDRGEIITNCVMLCKPKNWFIWHVMEQLFNQSDKCVDPISCTGPGIITKEYQKLQSTNRSTELPAIEDYQMFTDYMALHDVEPGVSKKCKIILKQTKGDWKRDICQEYAKRGGAARNISDRAYSYHTWFHIHFSSNKKKQIGKLKVKTIVPHAFIYSG